MQNVTQGDEAARLMRTQRWLALGTVDADAAPSVTYVPFATVDGAFGIAVSRLAQHTASLLERRPASILLVDDAAPEDPYARARLSIDVEVTAAAAESTDAESVWNALEARHGTTVATLRTLTDFYAVLLRPRQARLVLGFASAHRLSGEIVAEILRGLS